MIGCSAENEQSAESSVRKLVVPVHYRGSPKGEVLKRLCEIGSERSEILLGQNIGCTSDGPTELRDALKSVSILNRDGSYPAVVGIDYGWGEMDRESIRAANRLLIAHWKRGGLVTINFDPGNPLTGIPDPNDITPIDIYRLCESGTEENDTFMRQLETVAEGLQELQRAGVVVLWRPIHEPNGG
ncbi:MAG: glycosyl hydrolase, partial [Pirellula sp.]